MDYQTISTTSYLQKEPVFPNKIGQYEKDERNKLETSFLEEKISSRYYRIGQTTAETIGEVSFVQTHSPIIIEDIYEEEKSEAYFKAIFKRGINEVIQIMSLLESSNIKEVDSITASEITSVIERANKEIPPSSNELKMILNYIKLATNSYAFKELKISQLKSIKLFLLTVSKKENISFKDVESISNLINTARIPLVESVDYAETEEAKIPT